MRFGRPHRSRTRLATAFAAVSATALCAPASLLAAEPFERDQTPLSPEVTGGAGESAPAQVGTGGGSIVRMLVGLAVVLAVIYGVYWLLKTYGKSKRETDGDGRMDVVATTALGTTRSLHLVRVGQELVLVGAAEHGVTPIRIYDAAESRRLSAELDASDLVPLGEAGGNGPSAAAARVVDELRRRTARQ